MADLLSIGAVSQATGATIVAIRHYEELGLVEVAERVGGKRRFDQRMIGRVNFVRRARDAGFSLSEIASVLDDGRTDRNTLVDAKIGEMRQLRRRIDEMIELLTEVRACGCEAVDDCPTATSQLG